MSKKKNLKWICRRCMKTHPEVKVDHSTELLKVCSFCGTDNWCFPVTSGRPVKGGKKAPKEPETGTNTTDALVYDEIAPAETAPEAESAEENEALEEAVDEALEAVIEEAAEIEKEPEETPLEAESEPTEEELAEAQRLVEVAELEAKLEALTKGK